MFCDITQWDRHQTVYNARWKTVLWHSHGWWLTLNALWHQCELSASCVLVSPTAWGKLWIHTLSFLRTFLSRNLDPQDGTREWLPEILASPSPMAHPLKQALTYLNITQKLRQNAQHIQKQRHRFADKGHAVKATGFPIVVYGSESWTIKKTEHWRIDAFELWCWRRLLRVPWTAGRSNQSILKEINPE